MRSDQENEARERTLHSRYVEQGIGEDRARTLARVVVVVEEVLQTTLNEHQQAYVLRAVDALRPAAAAKTDVLKAPMLGERPTS